MTLIDQIKEDRGKGTDRPWEWRAEEWDEWGPVWSLGPGVLLADGPDGTPDGDEIDQADARSFTYVTTVGETES